MASVQQYVKLARSLPPRLLNFLRRHPPEALEPGQEAASPALATTSAAGLGPSPFAPYKHHQTGRWHNPRYSLRRQADLVKMARQHGVEELLPYTIKGTAERVRRRVEHGLRVKGTGEGQRVKGKLSERTMKARLQKRRQAMENMPKMIQEWKQRGHGRGWKQWPK